MSLSQVRFKNCKTWTLSAGFKNKSRLSDIDRLNRVIGDSHFKSTNGKYSAERCQCFSQFSRQSHIAGNDNQNNKLLTFA
jgi:hypothetical protein